MPRNPIPIADLQVRAHHLWAEQWMLLTCGDLDAKKYNTMTVGWGSLGTMWGKPFALVAVRPSRYTYEFMEAYETFTLSALDPKHKRALAVLGSKSGRDGDKIAEAGLTPEAATSVAAPCFAEAELVIECRAMYSQDLDPSRFMRDAIQENYPNHDYHRIYFGEILAVAGTKGWGG